ncbi:glucan endo-1,3-beta-glucosidase-like [Carica papaya]|uniref:glucan endo-1,3-beta-glucosidase-like n=1 Tax=Carica papaya TaxID=3649 RepID=UPI000B8CE8ED|nr:glucan endo-1,3-beta-glucosidase-like [Carica papaya]
MKFINFNVKECLLIAGGAAIGICYGRVADNLPPSSKVIDVLKSNGISTTRIFNADGPTLQSFSGTGISLMIGVPNEILPSLASGTALFSLQWLETNILSHLPSFQVRYIAVGNEVFSIDPFYSPYVVPAMINLYHALQVLNLTDSIKLSSPQAASVLSISYPPSAGTFNPYLQSVMVPLLRFLDSTKSPFMINVYPYISYLNSFESVTLDYALFRSGDNEIQDGGLTYGNLFDASVDAVVYAMEREGFAGIPLVVTETGWPTSGGLAASKENALAYNGNVVRRVLSDVGTPKIPGRGVEVYLFDLFDENGKGGEEYEKHFGIFGLDGMKLYDLAFN